MAGEASASRNRFLQVSSFGCEGGGAGILTSHRQDFSLKSVRRIGRKSMKKSLLVLLTVVALAFFGYACKQEQTTNATDTGATATDTGMSSTSSTMSTTETSMTGTTSTMSSTDTTGTTATMSSTDTSGTSGTMGTMGTTATTTTTKTKTTKKKKG